MSGIHGHKHMKEHFYSPRLSFIWHLELPMKTTNSHFILLYVLLELCLKNLYKIFLLCKNLEVY